LQAGGEFEDAALAFDFRKRFGAAGVGNVFAVKHDARIAAHFVVEAGVDKVRHGARIASLLASRFAAADGAGSFSVFGGEGGAGGVEVFRVNVLGNAGEGGQRCDQGDFGSGCGFLVQLLFKLVDFFGGEDALAQQTHLHLCEWIAHGVGFAFGRGAIELVVVRERMRIRPDAMAVDEGGTVTGAAMGGGGLKSAEAGFGIGAIDFSKAEVGEVGD